MIAIPNMEKPKGCLDCPVNDMACELWTEVANIKAHKHKDCSLIEIATCGECKHWNEETHGCNRNPSVEAWWETDFCSYGERRTDE